MRVSDETLKAYIQNGHTPLPVEMWVMLDLRDARAALRAWNMWREKCFDECDGDDAWTEALTLTKKALEGNDDVRR